MTPDSNSAIETHGLRKEFGQKVAVEDLSLSVGRGEVFGFLGANGAGKTTSVKMLLGLIRPTAGTGYLLGRPLGEAAGRARVGFLPEHFRFHDWLTAAEFLRLHAELYHIPEPVYRTRIPELLELVSLEPFAGQKLREFSKGMLQRVGLAQALLNEPDLVILDEPTSGLDPVGRLQVRDIIHGLRERGATVFLNSHLLSEVEITCDRVAFIKRGKVIQVNSLKSFMDGQLTVKVRARPLLPEVAAGLSRWGENIRVDGEQVSLTVNSEEALPQINHYLLDCGAEVYTLAPQRIALEDLFIQIVGTDGGL
ncbi:MAG TPA: ABC transporter ATP-binding protein [Anaerolineaceae bacterium]|nr:ABC transporter ATP-binding protein [Anaerolineaceae bacterium]